MTYVWPPVKNYSKYVEAGIYELYTKEKSVNRNRPGYGRDDEMSR